MISLDNINEIKKIDSENLYSSIEMFGEQVRQAWDEIKKIGVETSYKEVNNIIISGMGGSALGGRIIKSLTKNNLKVPIEVVADYMVPGYVDKNSLVVIISYSGNTEEPLKFLQDSLKRNAKLFVVTYGGQLEKLSVEYKIPGYIFKPIANPSGQPRMGLGYLVTSVLALFSRLKLMEVSDDMIEKSIEIISKNIKLFSRENGIENNISKRLSINIYNKTPVFIASEHLLGVAHAFKNQLNENAKSFAYYFDLPEANHHLMEGLKNPEDLKKSLYVLFIESENYIERIRKRYPVTKDVVKKNMIEVGSYKTTSKTTLEEVFEVLTLSLFVSYYLAILYDVNPINIPWVDYFKEKLR